MTTRLKALLIVLVCTAALAALYIRGRIEQDKVLKETSRNEAHFQQSFGEVSLIGKAAYVYDIRNGTELYAHNALAPLPLASLTKVMTALVALESLPKKAVVRISQNALAEDGDSGLFAGERWQLSDLARFTLVASSNDGARAMSVAAAKVLSPDDPDDSYFMRKMNDEALRLGLGSMSFANPTGLDATDLSSTGGTGSAKDMTMATVELMKKFPEVFSATTAPSIAIRSLDGYRHTANNTNSATGRTQLLLASKTGFTDLAGGNLSIVFDAGPGRPIAITVLGSTEEGRFADVERLVRATMRYITNR